MRSLIACFLMIMLFAAVPLRAQESSITVAMSSPTSLDPLNLSRFDVHARDLVENLYIGLTRLNARQGQIEPALAESWTISEDNLTWTFTLRDDVQWVRFHEGEVEAVRPVVAQDVVFAIQRGCDGHDPSPLTDNLFIIQGCRALANANTMEQLDANRTVAAQAIDDHTLQIKLLFPASYFLTMTSLPEFRPLPVEFIDDVNGNWQRPDNMVTSGAWVVSAWNPGSTMQLVRNPFWSGDEDGNLETIEIVFDVPDLAGQINNGNVDVARIDSTVQLDDPDLIRAGDGNSLVFLGFSFNMLNPEGQLVPSPLDVPEVRRALALALDRAAIAAAVPGSKAADHFTPASAIAAPSSPGAAFDPATAQQLLASAGYPACAGFPQLSVATSNDPEMLALAQGVVSQWQANLGCPADRFIVVQAPRQHILDSAHNTLDTTKLQRFSVWMLPWASDYPDAQGWVADALHCAYGYLRVGRACDQNDTVMNQAGLSTNLQDRFTSYNQVETNLFGTQGSFPVIPLVVEQHLWAASSNLDGIARYGVFQFDRWSN